MKPATLPAAASAASLPMSLSPALGQPWPHESARAQVCGAAPYVDDLPETKGTLYAAPSSRRVRTGCCAASRRGT